MDHLATVFDKGSACLRIVYQHYRTKIFWTGGPFMNGKHSSHAIDDVLLIYAAVESLDSRN